jgi:prepilin signal peptidase PulO-like enzyme (type II secretory pathway)
MSRGTETLSKLLDVPRATLPVSGTVCPVFQATILLALSGALIGTLLSSFSTWRTSRQPIPFDSAAELRIVEWARVSPGRAALCGLSPDDFSHPQRQAEWETLCATEATEGAVLALDNDVSEDATAVRELAQERELYPGASGWLVVDAEPPLVRDREALSVRRVLTGAVCGAIGMAVCGDVISSHSGGGLFGALALLALVVGGIVIGFVDHDTLFLDTPTLAVCGSLSWLFAVLYAYEVGDKTALLGGVVVAVAWSASFVVINLVYKLLRGITGMGFGDVLITLAAGGVPGVISRQPLLGFGGIVVAMILALGWNIPKLLSKKLGGRDAFALGPFLFTGWMAAWVFGRLIGVL